MRSTEKRTPFTFGSIPHSVLAAVTKVSNATASKVLMYLARRTFCFRKGSVVASYHSIANELGVSWRTIASATKKLVDLGYVIRKRVEGQAYKWWIPLDPDEFSGEADKGDFLLRSTPTHDRSIISPMKDRSYPLMQDRSWDQAFEEQSLKPHDTTTLQGSGTMENPPLKKDLKETNLKKEQQHCCAELSESLAVSKQVELEAELAANNDDEPLYKSCLRALLKHGVSQRVARKLCREHEHEMISSVLETVSTLTGIENKAGYLVAAIRDGGYESRPTGASFTKPDSKVKSRLQKRVKAPETDAPVTYRSVEDTRREQERLELERTRQEESYRKETVELSKRFRNLSDSVRESLKELAAKKLENMMPVGAQKREEMLQDSTMQRIACRSVLKAFLERIDQGLGRDSALAAVAG